MSYGMDGWNHDNDLVRRKDVMDSIVREYNRSRTGDGLKLAWIEKAVNEVPFAQPDVPDTNVGDMMNGLDTAISNAAYILDALMAYRNIVDSGDCNRCGKKKTCEYAPNLGQLVRYNCPFYKQEGEG